MRFPRENTRLAQARLLLEAIKNDPERLDAVLELQRILIRRIVQCEKRISRLQRIRDRIRSIKSKGRLPKEKTTALKARIKAVDLRIKELRQLMFLWRCFGDGIAAVYQSKYSLKHLFYDANYRVKQDAGTISGKTGFRLEYKILRMGIRMSVPVVLSDLTNIIRHGDVCALAGEDPVPIELKLSKNLGKRAKRQVEQLQVLDGFYANDGAVNFRGAINTKRLALRTDEINYEQELNTCLELAVRDGIASVSPEHGLRYIAFRYDLPETDRRMDGELEKHLTPSTQGTLLTPDVSWLPLYPFTLSMKPVNSLLFMQNIVGVVVLIDLEVLKTLFADHGIHAVALMDGAYALQICLDPADLMKGAFRISEQLFLRIACEFQSLTWFAEQYSSIFEASAQAHSDVNLDSLGVLFEPPPGWEMVEDCYLPPPEEIPDALKKWAHKRRGSLSPLG